MDEDDIDRFTPLARLALRVADPGGRSVLDAIEESLGAGHPPERIAELLLQGIPYSGFPGAVEALGALRELAPPFSPPEGAPPSEEEIPPTFRAVYRGGAEGVREALTTRHPVLAQWILGFAYGTVMERGVLNLATIEGLAVASLVGQRRRAPLHSHLRGALRNGWSGPALRELLSRLEAESDPATIDFARAVIDREA
ncbi:MAG: carboxymuconolactone decarboxylase family protein [Planctomycetota bacterium]|jgi:alkylhydroperoxidase/carboxymuconolactone decarboxylase family protein YurZ